MRGGDRLSTWRWPHSCHHSRVSDVRDVEGTRLPRGSALTTELALQLHPGFFTLGRTNASLKRPCLHMRRPSWKNLVG